MTETVRASRMGKTGNRPRRSRHSNGDIMCAAKRSALMSRIRGKDTKPEKAVAAILSQLDVRFETHCKDLPGRPDFVVRDKSMAIQVDGDFWHGWRFPAWRHKLQPKWARKIESNRKRDRRNRAKLRQSGWRVLRIWEHQIERDPLGCVIRIASFLGLSR
jgi:DNA mismatch endonuclease (patch repair protein)